MSYLLEESIWITYAVSFTLHCLIVTIGDNSMTYKYTGKAKHTFLLGHCNATNLTTAYWLCHALFLLDKLDFPSKDFKDYIQTTSTPVTLELVPPCKPHSSYQSIICRRQCTAELQNCFYLPWFD